MFSFPHSSRSLRISYVLSFPTLTRPWLLSYPLILGTDEVTNGHVLEVIRDDSQWHGLSLFLSSFNYNRIG